MDPTSNPTPTPTPTPSPTPMPTPTSALDSDQVLTPEPVLSSVLQQDLASTSSSLDSGLVSSSGSAPSVPESIMGPTEVQIPTPESSTTPPPPINQPTSVSMPSPDQTEAVTDGISGGEAPNSIVSTGSFNVAQTGEGELNVPMVATGPVPGSIGSAMSGSMGGMPGVPAINGAGLDNGMATNMSRNVSFNDPATDSNMTSTGLTKVGKKPNSKIVLLVLVVIAAIVALALGVILIMQIINGSSHVDSSVSNSSSAVIDSRDDELPNSTSNSVINETTLSCVRNMTDSEIILLNGVISGTISVSAEFDVAELSQISLVKSVIYSDESKSKNEPVETEIHESTAENLTATSAAIYYLPTNTNNKPIYDLDVIRKNYEDLDFTCELL